MSDAFGFLFTIFACSFLGFVIVAAVLSRFTRKPFVFWLGAMFLLAGIAFLVWSGVIDDGRREGWEFLALLILWGIAAVNFLIGFILCKIGLTSSHKDA